MLQAINHAVKVWDVDIISMSFGLRHPSSQEDLEPWTRILEDIQQAIREAAPRIMFAAASNSGKNNLRAFPSTCREVICIHASDGNGNEGGINPPNEDGDDNFMTLGIAVELVDGGKCFYKSGTSFATPIAAGIAANILELAARSKELAGRAKKRLKESEGMRKMFRMMSEQNQLAPYRYIAPWHYWPRNWTTDRDKAMSCWSTINAKFNHW
jgi:subtilisin family serine protease